MKNIWLNFVQIGFFHIFRTQKNVRKDFLFFVITALVTRLFERSCVCDFYTRCIYNGYFFVHNYCFTLALLVLLVLLFLGRFVVIFSFLFYRTCGFVFLTCQQQCVSWDATIPSVSTPKNMLRRAKYEHKTKRLCVCVFVEIDKLLQGLRSLNCFFFYRKIQ